MSLKIQKYNDGTYEERLVIGKRAEAEIVAELQAEGFEVTLPTVKRDMYDKIDAYIVITPALVEKYPAFGNFKQFMGRTIPVQIKQRTDSYPDFDYEFLTDRFEKGGKGREQKSKACVMICRSRGTKAAASMTGLKRVAQTLYNLNPEAMKGQKRAEIKFPEGHPLHGTAVLKRVEDKGRDNTRPFWKTILYFKKEG